MDFIFSSASIPLFSLLFSQISHLKKSLPTTIFSLHYCNGSTRLLGVRDPYLILLYEISTSLLENYGASESQKLFDCILLHIFDTYTPVCPVVSMRLASPQKPISSSREILHNFALKLDKATLFTHHYMKLCGRRVWTPEEFKPFIILTLY